ncbi:MAG: Trp family transcriptional regulator [Microgenomates group bacterium]|nr:Trp family transcriptional regulator [Microgenomates group bacterium]
MTRISRFPLKKETLDRLFDLFFTIVGKKNNFEDFKNTINDLLSPTERIMIAKRVAIIYLLLKQVDYFTISEILKVSPSTVAKFHLIMEKSTGIVPTFKKLLRNEKIGQLLEEIYLTFRGPGTYGVDWKSAWKDRQELERRKKIGI